MYFWKICNIYLLKVGPKGTNKFMLKSNVFVDLLVCWKCISLQKCKIIANTVKLVYIFKKNLPWKLAKRLQIEWTFFKTFFEKLNFYGSYIFSTYVWTHCTWKQLSYNSRKTFFPQKLFWYFKMENVYINSLLQVANHFYLNYSFMMKIMFLSRLILK